MRRVIYCPAEDLLSEANDLAKNCQLPINVGEFEELSNLDFDRGFVQVLEVPEIKQTSYLKEVENGFHQKINYLNDFVVFNKDFYILINDKKYFPIIIEKHKLKFVIEETQIGIKSAKIIGNKEKIEEFEYNVY
jgi:hypothetical protein